MFNGAIRSSVWRTGGRLRSHEPMPVPSDVREAEVIVVNLHRGYAGIAATMRALVPVQQRRRAVGFVDRARMGVPGTMSFWSVVRGGWSRPPGGGRRVWHSRRAPGQLVGILLKRVLRQPWELVYTSPSPRRHGRVWRTIVNGADAVIAVTDKAASFLDECDAVIPHGVDTEEFAPPVDRAAAWAEGGLPGKYGIGIFGRVRRSKGTDWFVEAMCRVLPRYPEFTAVVTGLCKPKDQPFLDALRAEVRSAGLEDRIRFLGDLPFAEIKRWYQRVSLCVAVPRSEGFGLTPLEAMASGTAALTSSEGCFPSVMVPGLNGDIVPTGDMPSLVAAFERLLADPDELHAMGRRGREHVLEHHSIEREADAIDAVYARLRQRAARARPRVDSE